MKHFKKLILSLFLVSCFCHLYGQILQLPPEEDIKAFKAQNKVLDALRGPGCVPPCK